MNDLTIGSLSEHGFLLPEPQQEIPASLSWVPGMTGLLPYLTEAGTDTLRPVLEKLPLLDMSQVTDPEVRRALMRDYHFLLIAYANALPKAERIPAPIAVPSCALAKSLGVRPMLSYASIVLRNMRFDGGDPFDFEHVQPIRTFTRSSAESAFLVSHGCIEHELRKALCQARFIEHDMYLERADAIIPRLRSIADAFALAYPFFGHILKHCPPHEYAKIRPWMDKVTDVIFEGLEELREAPQSFMGPSGAQTPTLPAIDALLTIRHKRDRFSAGVRTYMLPEHVRFIEENEHMRPLRAFVLSQEGNNALRDAYNACIQSVLNFRKVHKAFTDHYLDKDDERGTGGSMHRIFLQQYIDDTAAALIQ